MESISTSEQKAEYELIREEFQKRRDEINNNISQHKLVLEKSKQAISNLEKEVESLRPRIEGCDKHVVCKKCDINSMKYMGSTPNPDKYHVYECVICGHEEMYT